MCIFCVCNRNLGRKGSHSKYWKCEDFDNQQQQNIKTKLNYQSDFNDHCWVCHLLDHILNVKHKEFRHRKLVETYIYGDIVQEVVYFSWKNEALWVHLTKKFPQVSVMFKDKFLRWLAQSFDNLSHTHSTHVWVCFLLLLSHLLLQECQQCHVWWWEMALKGCQEFRYSFLVDIRSLLNM